MVSDRGPPIHLPCVEGPSSDLWESRWACPPATIRRQMARLSERSRSSDVAPPVILPWWPAQLEPASSPGPSTHRILSRQTPPRLTPFKCILGHQPPLFLWTGEPSEVPDLDYWFRARELKWIKCGCPPGICASANRAESWVPIVLVRSPSRGRLTKSPTDYNFHPGTAFTTFLPRLPPLTILFICTRTRRAGDTLLFQKSWTEPSRTFWMCGDGWPAGMSHRLGWIRTWRRSWVARDDEIDPHCWLNSTIFSWLSCTRTQRLWPPPSLLEDIRTAPGGGLMSGFPHRHSHLSHWSQHSPDHTPEYWSPAPAVCNQHSFIYHSLRHSSSGLLFHIPELAWLSLYLPTCAYPQSPVLPAIPVLPQFQHDPDPTAKSPTSVITDNQRTAICVSAHIVSVSALHSTNLSLKLACIHLPLVSVWPVLWQYGAYNASLYYA